MCTQEFFSLEAGNNTFSRIYDNFLQKILIVPMYCRYQLLLYFLFFDLSLTSYQTTFSLTFFKALPNKEAHLQTWENELVLQTVPNLVLWVLFCSLLLFQLYGTNLVTKMYRRCHFQCVVFQPV